VKAAWEGAVVRVRRARMVIDIRTMGILCERLRVLKFRILFGVLHISMSKGNWIVKRLAAILHMLGSSGGLRILIIRKSGTAGYVVSMTAT
jgi:hypothetical protein